MCAKPLVSRISLLTKASCGELFAGRLFAFLQPLEERGEPAHEAGALVVVDPGTFLGGTEVRVDDWGIGAGSEGSDFGFPPYRRGNEIKRSEERGGITIRSSYRSRSKTDPQNRTSCLVLDVLTFLRQ